ncbi:MAG: rRNA maturation RNase YbeY [Proteobacteria bacterium]|nr:rRNA maturation RNase YbeY [Pseudomonadota bacterium]
MEKDIIELPNCNVFVINEYKESLSFDHLAIIEKTLIELLKNQPCPKAEKFECSIKLSTNEEVRFLNKEYRGKDCPTNVLSFEDDLDDEFMDLPKDIIAEDFTYIGDIIFAVPVVISQAEEQNKTLEHHFTHLVVHSILHIFGLDHIDDKERGKMESLEIDILEKLNIDNPYN